MEALTYRPGALTLNRPFNYLSHTVIVFLGLTLLSIVGCADNSEKETVTPIEPIDWTKYYPSRPGSQWKYHVHSESSSPREEDRTVTVIGTEDVGGVTCHVIESTTGDNSGIRDFVQVTQSAVVLHKKHPALGAGAIEPPEPILEFPLREGHTWKWEGKYSAVGQIVIVHKVERSELVSVPAGSYSAFKVTQIVYDKKLYDQAAALRQLSSTNVSVEPNNEFTVWVAKDVGVIKQQMITKGVALSAELVSFTAGSDGDPPKSLVQPTTR